MAASDRRRRGAFRPERRHGTGRWGLLALLLLVAVALLRDGTHAAFGPPQPVAAQSVMDGAPRVRAAEPLPPSPPEGVRIPAVGVAAPLVPLGLAGGGRIETPPPDEPNLAGWYEGAVTPGERGTAVLVGQVDAASGPAVFHGLGALEKGLRVHVVRRDGRTAVFEVYGVEVFTGGSFPARRVYGSTGFPELRVLTCGGRYGEHTGYTGEVVVFARMTEVRP
ncbi:class F sortase [Streptomyces lycii]|uniref:Class F sortase n=1 Tax=Streptomyces lycii TaxID=2654337 RepID=A0ABQ7FMX1_9ACTN|nr:class F sortase [Streptomyces lycii]KAF4408964.1 class F sortase [Streptomyces lycii]